MSTSIIKDSGNGLVNITAKELNVLKNKFCNRYFKYGFFTGIGVVVVLLICILLIQSEV